MGYFDIGIAVAVCVSTAFLAAPLNRSWRAVISSIFEDTFLGESFYTIDNEDDQSDVALQTSAAFIGGLLWTLLTVLLWCLLAIAWPLTLPVFIVVILVIRRAKRKRDA